MRIFVTHAVKPEISRAMGVSIAAANFSHNLIEGSLFERVYAILPPFVRGKKKYTPSGDIQVVYSEFFRRGALSKVAAIIEQLKVFAKIPAGANVWFYNVSPLNSYLIRLLRWLKPTVKIFIIILDLTPETSLAKKSLPIINAANGRISLSTSNLFNPENLRILPGVVPYETEMFPTIDKISKDFLISGQLSDNISMLSQLLDVFRSHPEINLHITGIPPKKAVDFAQNYPNIKCHGQVSRDEYAKILHKCPFLLSTRDPVYPENLCNFPSKIIEGILHNRIIISTIDYPQLGDIRYLKINAANLEDEIMKIVNMDQDYLLAFANQKGAVEEAFNTTVWANVMSELENTAD